MASMALVLIIVLAGTAIFLLVRTPKRPRSQGPVSSIPLVIGAALLLVVLIAETVALFGRGEVSGDDVPLRLAATTDGEIDRLQFLFVVADRSGMIAPRRISSRVVPLPTGGGEVSAAADALDTDVELRWPSDGELSDATYRVRTWAGLNHHTTGGTGIYRDVIDLGDGRPFARIVWKHPVSLGVRLRSLSANRLSIYVRTLSAEEELQAVSFADARAALHADLDDRAFEIPSGRALTPYHELPIKRMLSELAPAGTLLLLVGLTLVFYRRVSLVRGASYLALGLVLTTGGFARLETSRAESALGSAESSVRMDASATLARSKAFPLRASVALEAAYAKERDPTRKGATLLLTAEGGNPMRNLPAAARIRAAAEGSADARLRELAGQIVALDP